MGKRSWLVVAVAGSGVMGEGGQDMYFEKGGQNVSPSTRPLLSIAAYLLLWACLALPHLCYATLPSQA